MLFCHKLHINDQFDFVNTKLQEYINNCAPIKVVTIPAKYVIREKWMTKGLLQSSLNLQKMRKRETGKKVVIYIDHIEIYITG